MIRKRLLLLALALTTAFVLLVLSATPFMSISTVEAHGTQGPNHEHFEGYGLSIACVDLEGNPFGYYKIYHVYPSADYYADGQWHLHYPYYWDHLGHITGGSAIGWRYECGF